jgi:hypothetical protein
MTFAILAILCAGLFAGAAASVTSVELPARLSCGPPGLDPDSEEASGLLRRWGRLHAVRTLLGVLAFWALVACVAATAS